MVKHSILALITTVIASLAPYSFSFELSSYRAEITATRYGAVDIKAKGTTTFSLNNNTWQNEVSVKGGGLKSEERSKGFLQDEIFKPESYRKRTKFLFIKENIDWAFSWAESKVEGNVKKDKYKYDLETSLHDPLSYQAPLRIALANGETSIAFLYLRYNRPQKLTFEVIGEELLSLGKHQVHTLIVKQTAPMSSSRKKLIWVAKDFDYIPVKFASYKNDKLKDDIEVKRLWIDGKEVSFANP